MENILINFTSDPSGLQPGIDGLVQMEVADKELADQVKKTSAEMSKRDKAVSDGITKSAAGIEKLSASFKGLDKSIVGGTYQQKLRELQKEIEGTSDEFKQLSLAMEFAKRKQAEFKPNSPEWIELQQHIEQAQILLQEFGNQEAETETKTKSLKTQLREMKEEISAMEQAGDDSSESFIRLSAEAAKLEDQIGDTNARVRALASDTANIDAAIGGIQTLASGFQIATGAAALLGDEGEDLQKALVKLNAIMAITNGLREIQNALQAQSIVRLKAEAIGQTVLATSTKLTASTFNALGVSVEASSVAFKALRAAIITTGIGAVVVGIGFLIEKLSSLGDAEEDAADSTALFNTQLEIQAGLFDRTQGKIETQNSLMIAQAKKRGASEQEVNGLILEGYQNLERANKEHIDKMLEQGGALYDANYKPFRDIIKSGDDAQKALDGIVLKLAGSMGKIPEETKIHLENTKAFLTQLISLYNKQDQLRTNFLETSLGFDADTAEKARQKAKEEAEKSREQLERDLKARLELRKQARQKEIDFLNAQGDADNPDITARSNALSKALVLEQEQIIDQRNFELNNDRLTANERILIVQKADEAIIEKKVEYATRVLQLESEINASLKRDIDATTAYVESEAAKSKAFLDDILKSNLGGNDAEANAAIQADLKLYQNRTIGREEYERRKQETIRKYQKQDIEAEIAHEEALQQTDGQSKEVLAASEERLAALKKQLRAADLEDQEIAAQKEIEIATAKEQQKQALAEQTANLAKSLFDAAFDAASDRHQKELDLDQQLYDNKLISEKEFNNRKKIIAQEQAADQKAKALFDIAIELGKTIFQIQAQAAILGLTPIVGPILEAKALAQIPFVIGEAVVQGALIAAKKYKHGEVRIDGPGTNTSDSIPAFISKNESVINAQQSIKHEGALRAINDDRYHQYLLQHELPRLYSNLSMPDVPEFIQTTTQSQPFDYEKMAEAFAKEIANNPSHSLHFDENGFHLSVKKGNEQINYVNKKLSM
jgi:hypothetical protein